MKVFFIDSSMFLPSYNIQFCKALKELGVDVRYLSRQPRAKEQADLEGLDFEPFFYRHTERIAGPLKPIGKGVEYAVDLARLARLAERERPDIIHFSWVLVPMIERLFLERLRRTCPLLLTVHNSVPFHNESSSSLMMIGHDQMPSYFDHLIPHTISIQSHLLELGVPAEKMSQMPHPVIDLPAPRGPVPGCPERRKTILLFGNIKQYKGVDVLVDAALALIAKHPDILIAIAGPTFISLDEVKSKVSAAGAERNFFFDQRYLNDQDIADYLDIADVVVFPYREIDTSGAFATASQCGKPIVASDIGTFAEPPARDYVLRLPPGNALALADALGRLVSEPVYYEKWSARGADLRDKMYSWSRFARECNQIYESLAHRRRTEAIAA